VTVKGKDRPVTVYEVVDLAGAELPPGRARALELYREGLEAYRTRQWAAAKTHFLAALEAWPDDGPSRVYAERCDEHLTDTPAADWDFVVRRTSK
jgi:adenylate cyclase